MVESDLRPLTRQGQASRADSAPRVSILLPYRDAAPTLPACLRSILRQDPDIILVGEIRDQETGQIAIQASLTGHVVFSTLHTNDAPATITRLVDMGLEPFLVTATLEGIVGQRLVRKICKSCKEEYEPSKEMLMELNIKKAEVTEKVFYYGRGCDDCNNTGYKGRMAIFELMVMDEVLRRMVMDQASTQELRTAARKKGMRTLRESGILAIFDDMTTIEEVVRETLSEDAE